MMEKVGKLNFKGFTLASQIRPYLQTAQNNAPHTANRHCEDGICESSIIRGFYSFLAQFKTGWCLKAATDAKDTGHVTPAIKICWMIRFSDILVRISIGTLSPLSNIGK